MIVRVLILLFLSLVLSNAVSAGKPATMQSPSVYAGNQRIGQYLFTDYSANKIRVMSDNPDSRVRKATRGSETSQYPEEMKSKEIPLVAASEQGLV